MATEHLTSTPEGVFRCRYNGIEVTPPLCILKYPFKEEVTWDVSVMIGAESLKEKFASGKIEEITTPAGKFKAARDLCSEFTTSGTKIKDKNMVRT